MAENDDDLYGDLCKSCSAVLQSFSSLTLACKISQTAELKTKLDQPRLHLRLLHLLPALVLSRQKRLQMICTEMSKIPSLPLRLALKGKLQRRSLVTSSHSNLSSMAISNSKAISSSLKTRLCQT